MPIQRERDFLITRDLGITPSIGIETDKLRDCIAAAKAKGFEGVFGSPTFGFRGKSLDFLAELPHVRQVWFWGCTFDSIEGLYTLKRLEHCGVMEKRPGIDFSRFPRLESVVTHWNLNDTGFADSSIRRCYLWHFKPRAKSFAGFSFPPRTSLLEFNWANPASLEGLETLPELRELGIHRSRNMEDLSLLPRFAPNLKKLIVTTSNRITCFAGIEDHPSLELAIVNGNRIKG